MLQVQRRIPVGEVHYRLSLTEPHTSQKVLSSAPALKSHIGSIHATQHREKQIESMTDAIILRNVTYLHKKSGRGVSELSDVFTPKIYGILGENGAGKTTLLKLLAGLNALKYKKLNGY